MATWRGARRWRRNSMPVLAVTLAGMLIGGAMGVVLREGSLSAALLESGPASSHVAQQAFPVCAGGRRVTCVVDGDTFWLDGVKIRIADIDTPEISKPGCSAEAALGARATVRLAELLVEGPFELSAADRDEDRYGRKLRIVSRQGQSLGEILVQEGLAHRWGGPQRTWC